MATLNANDLLINAVNSGSLTPEAANNIVRGVGITVTPGEGRVTNAFNSDSAANTRALQKLSSMGLVPKQSLQDHMANTVNNPDLAAGAEMTPQLQNVQQGELQVANPISASPIAGVAPVTAPKIQGQQVTDLDSMMVSYEQALKQISQGSGTYQANQVGNQTPQSVAQQGNVSELATVQGQLKKLYAESEDGQVPIWAQGAVRKAEGVLAARGLGSSSIAAGAITAAVQESAINIAAPDAATYFQMDMKNLDNRQQTELENTRLRQQSLLTDTAALNAAAQFNAASTQDIEKFQATLVSEITTGNANRIAAIKQFNTAEVNKVSTANAQLEASTNQFNNEQQLAVQQYNSQLKFQVDQFNSNNATLVDQSNVVWRRNINTANTAAVNAATQLNVQNKFNLSNYALNALWQSVRDEVNHMYSSADSAQNYQQALGLAGANREGDVYLQNLKNDSANTLNLYKSLGALGVTLVSNLGKK